MAILSNDDATPKVDNDISDEEDSNLKKKENHITLFSPPLQPDNLNLQAARVKDVHPDWTDEDIFQVPTFPPELAKSSEFPLIIFLKSKL